MRLGRSVTGGVAEGLVMKALQTLLYTVGAWQRAGILHDLVTSRDHAPYLSRHRTTAIASRVRLVAAGFAIPTLAWIVLDLLALDWKSAMTLALMRLGVAGLFVAIALRPSRDTAHGTALALLALVLACPLLLMLTAEAMVGPVPAGSFAAFDLGLYRVLPQVVLAGMTVFPLVQEECLLLAVPVVAVGVLAPWVHGPLEFMPALSSAWTLLLLLGVFMMAQMLQLNYMMVLLGRASYDPLTGAFTRRSGIEMLEVQCRLAAERNQPLAVAFFDIDSFKSINDRYGHEAGDQVLAMAAKTLTGHVRRGDPVIRWGGEEFVVLFPNVTQEGVEIVMRRIFSDWLGTRPDGGYLTASIGVAERITDGISDWPSLVERADKRMYQAKQSGKARCVMGEALVMLPEG